MVLKFRISIFEFKLVGLGESKNGFLINFDVAYHFGGGHFNAHRNEKLVLLDNHPRILIFCLICIEWKFRWRIKQKKIKNYSNDRNCQSKLLANKDLSSRKRIWYLLKLILKCIHFLPLKSIYTKVLIFHYFFKHIELFLNQWTKCFKSVQICNFFFWNLKFCPKL